MRGPHSDFNDLASGLMFMKRLDGTAIVRRPLKPYRTKYVIPERVTGPDGREYTVTEIGYGAFAELYHLHAITLPNTLKVIDEFAFKSCRSLQEVVIPAFINAVRDGAFLDCISLKRFECWYVTEQMEADGIDFLHGQFFPAGQIYTLLGGFAFAGCEKLEFVKGLFAFDPHRKAMSTFEDCISLNEVCGTITVYDYESDKEDGYYGIPPRCFKNCKSLRDVTINVSNGCWSDECDKSGHGEVHTEAFAGCESLEHIDGDFCAYTIYRDAFKDCGKLQNNPYTTDFYVGPREYLKRFYMSERMERKMEGYVPFVDPYTVKELRERVASCGPATRIVVNFYDANTMDCWCLEDMIGSTFSFDFKTNVLEFHVDESDIRNELMCSNTNLHYILDHANDDGKVIVTLRNGTSYTIIDTKYISADSIAYAKRTYEARNVLALVVDDVIC